MKMSEYRNEQIATNIDLWNEYFNTSALMSDEEFYSMSIEEKIEMLVEAYGVDDDEVEA